MSRLTLGIAEALWKVPVGLVLTDQKGKIKNVNGETSRLMGYSMSELEGLSPAQFKSGNTSPDVYRTLWKTILSGETWEGVFVNRTKSGNCIYVKERIVPVENGFLAMHVDVTDLASALSNLKSVTGSFHRLEAAIAELATQNTHLLLCAQDGPLGAAHLLMDVLEHKDFYTVGHGVRVCLLAEAVARQMGVLQQEESEEFRNGCLLHDVGRVGVPDTIILKQARLTPEEKKGIELHTIIGFDLIRSFTQSPILLGIIRSHHENMNGTGYPDGLRGEQIPMLVRIVRVCDSYDAMTSNRPYRKPLTPEDAIRELQFGAHTGIFDKTVVKNFVILSSTGQLRPFAHESAFLKSEDLVPNTISKAA